MNSRVPRTNSVVFLFLLGVLFAWAMSGSEIEPEPQKDEEIYQTDLPDEEIYHFAEEGALPLEKRSYVESPSRGMLQRSERHQHRKSRRLKPFPGLGGRNRLPQRKKVNVSKRGRAVIKSPSLPNSEVEIIEDDPVFLAPETMQLLFDAANPLPPKPVQNFQNLLSAESVQKAPTEFERFQSQIYHLSHDAGADPGIHIPIDQVQRMPADVEVKSISNTRPKVKKKPEAKIEEESEEEDTFEDYGEGMNWVQISKMVQKRQREEMKKAAAGGRPRPATFVDKAPPPTKDDDKKDDKSMGLAPLAIALMAVAGVMMLLLFCLIMSTIIYYVATVPRRKEPKECVCPKPEPAQIIRMLPPPLPPLPKKAKPIRIYVVDDDPCT